MVERDTVAGRRSQQDPQTARTSSGPADRKVGALGVDVASIDYGASTDFIVHRIAAEAGVPGFENLTSLDQLPAKGAALMALPMKIRGGSGGPLRAVAWVP